MNIIITGSSGMVGRGVLLEALENQAIRKILLINRSPLGVVHEKVEEILLSDFSHVEEKRDQLHGYDACLYCMGISAMGLSEEAYTAITYDTTFAFAQTLHGLNSDMVFVYVSGDGTDSSEAGRMMWARVKGKTENMLFDKGFKDAYAFRPGAIIPEKGIKSRTRLYNIIYFILRPFFSLLKRSNNITTTTKLGLVMLHCLSHPQEKKILYNPDINKIAHSAIS